MPRSLWRTTHGSRPWRSRPRPHRSPPAPRERDEHLRSADFLDAEQHPLITFKSTALSPAGDDWKLTGDLTIRGVTRPVQFDLTFEGTTTDPYGNTKAGFTAVGEIERRDWDLTWNVPLENGGVLVSEKFKIEFDIEAALQA